MFKGKIELSTFKTCMDGITAIVDEGRVLITHEGITLRAVDPANVAMISFSLPQENFVGYDVTEDAEFCMDFSRLVDVLKIGGITDIDIVLDKKKSYMQSGNLNYSFSLLDTTAIRKNPKIEGFEHHANVVLETDVFLKTVRAASNVGEVVTIGIDKNDFYMTVEGDTDVLRLGLSEDQVISMKPKTVSSVFSLEYLVDFAKGMRTADLITIHMDDDYPLQIDFDVGAQISYMLAPRISVE